MTRFQILEQIGESLFPISSKELAKRTNHRFSHTRSYQAYFTTRLRRLWQQGLVNRRLDTSQRTNNRLRGVYVWRLSRRGLDRLEWAKAKGVMHAHRAICSSDSENE
jgi:hypothetical protein